MTLTLALISTLYAFAEDPASPAPPPEPVRPTVVFIHGLYLNASCWDDWREVFETQG